MKIDQHKILIIDFGSQYTQLIAKKVRQIGIYCEIIPPNTNTNFIKKFKANGIILSGGPQNITKTPNTSSYAIFFELGIPVLGICYGMHLMAIQFGGNAINSNVAEFGFTKINITNNSVLFNGIYDELINDNATLDVWMSHGVEISSMPNDFMSVASSDNCKIAAIANPTKHFYGIQFHPEVTHTKQGTKILKRFCVDICKCQTHWHADNIINHLITEIKSTVGNNKVLLALSGGVDSSVVATLLQQAIGDNLVCIFVDTGLLRLNESDEVMRVFANSMNLNIIKVNAANKFFHALADVDDPETKRKIIGRSFIEIFEQEATKLKNITFLAQGTIYPDIIESAANSDAAKVIKSHHNVGGLPDKLKLTIIEPLKQLFKDEVRIIGTQLKVPHNIIHRHPFPGPGLGVRIIGAVTKEYADILRVADDIFITELKKHKLYDKTSQAFAVFLPIKSVGIVGDERRYEFVVALRAVTTIDFMTAKWANLPYDFLATVSNKISNTLPQVSRVVYDISGKPPATIEWE